jgi:lysophospholipase L1-like esterase
MKSSATPIHRKKICAAALLLLSALLVPWFAFSPVLGLDARPDSGPDRFAKRIETFEAWDKKNSFPEDAILFVGSSSIAGWGTASAFPGKPIINRGLGGSHVSDINNHYDELVKPYKPSVIVFYAGDNDIKRGKSPKRVLADFKAFADRVREDLDRTRILFVSIKPSLARWQHWPRMAKANELIRDYVADRPNMTYIDLASPLLDEAGQPKAVFAEDGLHLNEYGYRLWVEGLRPHLYGSVATRSLPEPRSVRLASDNVGS